MSEQHGHNIHRGGACNNCRRRKIRCDGLRPVCGQCHNRPPRSGHPCLYEQETSPAYQTSAEMQRTIGRLRAKIDELEKSNGLPQDVLLRQPYAPSASPVPEPPSNIRNSYINTFLNRFASSAYFFLDAHHFAQGANQSPGHPHRPSSALLSCVYLWASVLSNSSPPSSVTSFTTDGPDADTFLLATLEQLPGAINRLSSAPPGSQLRLLLETIQTEVLLSFYYLHESLSVQGRYHAGAAASLAIGAGFNKLGGRGHGPPSGSGGPPFIFAQPTQLGGSPAMEGASIAAFWATVIINNVWAAAQGGPAPISSYGTEVDAPWPGGQQGGSTIKRFLNGQDVDGHSPIALLAKASTLVERIAALTSGGQVDSQTYTTLDQRLHAFQAALPHPQGSEESIRITHLLADLAIIRLHLPHAQGHAGVRGARQKAMAAADRIALLAREIAGLGETTVDPVLGPACSAAHSACTLEMSALRAGPPTMAQQYHAVEQRVEGLVRLMTRLADISPIMRQCLGSVMTQTGHGHPPGYR
ncbi:Zn(2)-C6 fungal-type domain-containing protein [Mycena indigotica]|uniref:Zn(2)-C6 fungal-type domain-containing protein n=1 Tax=Mycena indigotica TaxID=2126181 RepID=A0A8H6VWV6_9AGAR|nr:Zn(2)-C6 fungal-type domain-containing protein [Mycena indigotica]KAF7291144.1 Zn(2)-C6 fungal-type domain-containing protein [Mycena indigotica]